VGTDLSLLPISRDPSLVGYWKFDEGTGGTAYDASGHGNMGNITGNPLWQSGSNCRIGGCINFNVTGKVNIPSLYNASFPTNGTLIMWINSSVWDVGVEHHFFDAYSSLRNHIFLRNNYSVPGGYLQIAFQSTSAYVFSDIPQVPVGSWFQIAVVWDTVSHKGYIYLNGNLYSQGSISDSSWTPNGQSTYLNDSGNNQGSEDDVRIYNRALSASEIHAIYNAGN
jgi:hypothetical protein